MFNQQRLFVWALTLAAVVQFRPNAALGQTTTQPGGSTGGLGAGLHPAVPTSATPGQWVRAAVAEFTVRQNTMLGLHGGATLAAASTTPSARNVFLVGFLKAIFDGLNEYLLSVFANSTTGNALPPTTQPSG